MYAYSIAVVLTFFIWLLLFLVNKTTRREMLVIGMLITPFVVLDTLTVPNYWEPITIFNLPVGIEGFLFTFFMAGIAAVLYEIVFRKKYKYGKLHVSFLTIFLVPTFVSITIVYFLKLNIIYLFIVGLTLMTISELSRRKDLTRNSIISAVELLH
jgi:hypothetical protein